jgi:hypothetical protein
MFYLETFKKYFASKHPNITNKRRCTLPRRLPPQYAMTIPGKPGQMTPVNWKASHIFGIKLAARNITARSAAINQPNLRLSQASGRADGKRSPSMLSRSAWNMTGREDEHEMEHVADPDGVVEE